MQSTTRRDVLKRQVGEWTGDTNAQVEGAAQQVKGKAQKAWGNVKDAAQNASDNAHRDSQAGVERERELEREREAGREEERQHVHVGTIAGQQNCGCGGNPSSDYVGAKNLKPIGSGRRTTSSAAFLRKGFARGLALEHQITTALYWRQRATCNRRAR